MFCTAFSMFSLVDSVVWLRPMPAMNAPVMAAMPPRASAAQPKISAAISANAAVPVARLRLR